MRYILQLIWFDIRLLYIFVIYIQIHIEPRRWDQGFPRGMWSTWSSGLEFPSIPSFTQSCLTTRDKQKNPENSQLQVYSHGHMLIAAARILLSPYTLTSQVQVHLLSVHDHGTDDRLYRREEVEEGRLKNGWQIRTVRILILQVVCEHVMKSNHIPTGLGLRFDLCNFMNSW